MPSPNKLNANTVKVIAAPGKTTSHQGGTKPELRASANILPQVGVGGGPRGAEREGSRGPGPLL